MRNLALSESRRSPVRHASASQKCLCTSVHLAVRAPAEQNNYSESQMCQLHLSIAIRSWMIVSIYLSIYLNLLVSFVQTNHWLPHLSFVPPRRLVLQRQASRHRHPVRTGLHNGGTPVGCTSPAAHQELRAEARRPDDLDLGAKRSGDLDEGLGSMLESEPGIFRVFRILSDSFRRRGGLDCSWRSPGGG